jgi:hypothetical protein
MSHLGRLIMAAKRKRARHAAMGNAQHVSDLTVYINQLVVRADWAIWD